MKPSRPSSGRPSSGRSSPGSSKSGGKSRRSVKPGKPAAGAPASQRQLRAGELVRHALAELLREVEVRDAALAGVSVTVAEVRASPDLRHATVFVEPLGGADADAVVAGLNRAAKFLRGRLGRTIDMKFTPDLHFVKDQSFDTATRMNAMFAIPEVARDLAGPGETPDEDAPGAYPDGAARR